MTGDSELAATPVARVPGGTRVYAIGDVHGRADLLVELWRRIGRDAAAAIGRRRVLIHVGDYVDRGEASAEVIHRLVESAPSGFEIYNLKGNHEDLMQRSIGGEPTLPIWLANGGTATLASYGIDCEGTASASALMSRMRAALPEAHARFLAGLKLMHVEGDYAFVHAGIRPGIALERQDPHDLLWIREPFLGSLARHGRTIVHGHTIRPLPEVRTNRIGIDTGAFYSGRLTALVLDGASRDFLTT
jgi:serine/threonine protein phosphatase 1